MRSPEEWAFFSFFFTVGLATFLIVPPINRPRKLCQCICYLDWGWKCVLLGVLTYFCLCFCFFFLLLDLMTDLNLYVLDGNLSTSDVYLYVSVASAGLALICSLFGGQTIWAIVAWILIVSVAANVITRCTDSQTCFFLRSVVSIVLSGLLSAGASALLYRIFGDIFAKFQTSLAASFTLVFSLLVLILSFENWKYYTMYLPFGVSVGLAIIRVLFITFATRCVICMDYEPLSDKE